MPKAPPNPNTRVLKSQQQLPYSRRPPVQIANKPPTRPVLELKATVKPGSTSHLYTDDNPSTTLHGTGFKDAATALHTLQIMSQRSLTYQYQVVNTMYNRAKHHPARKRYENGNAEKQALQGRKFDEAMAMFKDWLDHEYVDAKRRRKEEGRDFKPLLKKEVVKRYLSRLRQLETFDMRFPELYAELPRGKRLANVLVHEDEPGGIDWEIMRELELAKLVEERAARDETGEEGLWNEGKGGCSEWHLRCIGWAWSPIVERRLPP